MRTRMEKFKKKEDGRKCQSGERGALRDNMTPEFRSNYCILSQHWSLQLRRRPPKNMTETNKCIQ